MLICENVFLNTNFSSTFFVFSRSFIPSYFTVSSVDLCQFLPKSLPLFLTGLLAKVASMSLFSSLKDPSLCSFNVSSLSESKQSVYVLCSNPSYFSSFLGILKFSYRFLAVCPRFFLYGWPLEVFKCIRRQISWRWGVTGIFMQCLVWALVLHI